MALQIDTQKILSTRSSRVKSSDLHPTEPWLLLGLYNGKVDLWNFESQQLVKTIYMGILNPPVRVAKFVTRKNWIVIGDDDARLTVYNYNTWEKLQDIQAHNDYIRDFIVHPTQPFIISASDDASIKLWNWEQQWECIQTFRGHTYLVMCLSINPKDNNMFASASQDLTVKVWHLGWSNSSFTLEGHTRGVNCVCYHPSKDKPYLISGADDNTVKVWDYQMRSCVHTLEAHTKSVLSILCHSSLPIILSGSEDQTLRMWHSGTFRTEKTLNYNLDRLWCISCHPSSNKLALGFDEGCVLLQVDKEEPVMSMDNQGKITWAKQGEIQQVNTRTVDGKIKDGEQVLMAVKELGSCDIHPQNICHSPNGRFLSVCGAGEYIIYTSVALRNKSFGQAKEFVWSHDSSMYAITESSSVVKFFKNFKEKVVLRMDSGIKGIYGGNMLGVRSVSSLAFYDWETTELIRRVEIMPNNIFWSETGELVCIATDDSFFILKYCAEAVKKARENREDITEDGIEDALEVVGEIEETVKTGIWVGDCFIYTNSVNRLNYYVGGEIVTVAHLDRVMYLLGYIPKDNRLYLGDKELNVVSFSLLLSVLEYQTSVMRTDFETADKVLPTIPLEYRTQIAHFLEKQGYKLQALAITLDTEHKFELAVAQRDLETAYQIAENSHSKEHWKQLAELAISKCEFGLAQECLHQAQDFGGLLLLASSAGNAQMVARLGETAEKADQNNVAFLAHLLLGQVEKCLEVLIKTERFPEAAFFSRTYLPSQISRVVTLWKEQLARKVNRRCASSLADPREYENLFPTLKEALQTEDHLGPKRHELLPAEMFPSLMLNTSDNTFLENNLPPSGEETRELPVGEELTDADLDFEVIYKKQCEYQSEDFAKLCQED